MEIKVQRNPSDVSKAEVGEIDTTVPFQSVRAAVSLFGEAISNKGRQDSKRPKSPLEERIYSEEAKLQLALKEVGKFKQQLRNVEAAKAQLQAELERSKGTIEDLTHKLNRLQEPPREHENSKSNELKRSREEYMACIQELKASKEELEKIQQDLQVSMYANEANNGKELLMKSKSVKKSPLKPEEILSNLALLKKEYDPEDEKIFKTKLEETISEINNLHVVKENMDRMRAMIIDLECAKLELNKVTEEKNILLSTVESLMVQLDGIKEQHSELRLTEEETQSITAHLHETLSKSKSELDEAMATDLIVTCTSEYLSSALFHLSEECENVRKEAEAMKKNAQTLKEESEKSIIALQDMEKRLKETLTEADKAKKAETEILDHIKSLSAENSENDQTLSSKSDMKIIITKEEYDHLCSRIKEIEKSSEMKISEAIAEIEIIKSNENEAKKKLEASEKTIKVMQEAIAETLKMAETAEAASCAVKVELKRMKEKEQRGSEQPLGVRLRKAPEISSLQNPEPQKAKSIKMEWGQKLERAISLRALFPSLSSIFHRKRAMAMMVSHPISQVSTQYFN